MYYPTRFNHCAGAGKIPRDYRRVTHAWVALSRDLLTRWGGPYSYGDTIIVQGIAEGTDGFYVVADAMNKRYSNHIDILVSREDTLKGKWRNVKIAKANEVTFETNNIRDRTTE